MQRTLCVHVFHVCLQQEAVTGIWLLGWISSRQWGWLFLFTFLGVTQHDGGVEWEYIIFRLQSSWAFQVCVCMCVCVCTIECLSIACSCVAKQPCVCTLEWGWEGREAPGQQRQTLTSTAASDWTHQCSWWMRLTIIILTWIVSLKVHSLTPQKVKSIFSVRNILLLLHTAKKRAGDFGLLFSFPLYGKELYFPTQRLSYFHTLYHPPPPFIWSALMMGMVQAKTSDSTFFPKMVHRIDRCHNFGETSFETISLHGKILGTSCVLQYVQTRYMWITYGLMVILMTCFS